MRWNQASVTSASAPVWLLVLVTLSGTMAMHIFVPALPLAGVAFGAEPSAMQQTITLYVVGLALGQLVYGPMSDTRGRRPTLLIGLSIYLCASVAALYAQSLEWLVLARLLQALGGAAGITLGRVVVRDTSSPERVLKNLALLNLLTMVGPGIAPVVGAYLADHFGWRAIYLFLVCMGCAMLICAFLLLPETNRHLRPLLASSIVADYRILVCNPRFRDFMIGGACSSTMLYPYLATVPYIVHEQLGLPIRYVGWFAASTIVGASLGSFVTSQLAARVQAQRLMYSGACMGVAMAVLLLIVQLMGDLTGSLLLAITMAMTFGAGLAAPAALSRAMASSGGLAGSAAGLYGFGQMAMGAIGTKLVGYGDVPAVSCAIVQTCFAAIALCSFRFADSKHDQHS